MGDHHGPVRLQRRTFGIALSACPMYADSRRTVQIFCPKMRFLSSFCRSNRNKLTTKLIRRFARNHQNSRGCDLSDVPSDGSTYYNVTMTIEQLQRAIPEKLRIDPIRSHIAPFLCFVHNSTRTYHFSSWITTKVRFYGCAGGLRLSELAERRGWRSG